MLLADDDTHQDVRDYINSLQDDVVAILQDEALSDSDQLEQLSTKFKDHIDGALMARYVLGKHYKSLSNEQKEHYKLLYVDYLTHAYVPKFDAYANTQFEIVKVTQQKNQILFGGNAIDRARRSATTACELPLGTP